MEDHRKKPGSPGDIRHHGVKGMRWGVRKEEDSVPGGGKVVKKTPEQSAAHNAEVKQWMADAAKMPKLTPAQAQAKFKENQAKAAAKMQPDGPDEHKGLSSGQKKALAIGGGAVLAGGAYLAYRKFGDGKLSEIGVLKDWNELVNAGKLESDRQMIKSMGINSFRDMDNLAGKPIDSHNFQGLVGLSQGKTWYGDEGFLHPRAWARPEFELPVGHEFFRMSLAGETDFSHATYSTHSLDDFNRYVAGFRSEKGPNATFQKISWKSTKPIRVPNLATTMGTLHEVMTNEGKSPPTNAAVMKAYNDMSGGGWESARAKSFVSALKGKGYHALVDEMDAGVIGSTPLIYFGGQETSTKKKSELFDKTAIERAEQLLKEIDNPPGRKY